MNKVCILDYGFGNIASLHNALSHIGYKTDFYSENKNKKYDIIFIPGVGSFHHASKILEQDEFKNFIHRINKKSVIFGICLGMQVMFTTGDENGKSNGLNFVNGNVNKLPQKLILPIIGWKKTSFTKKISSLNKYNNTKFYYVHSYAVKNLDKDLILSKTSYEDIEYISSFQHENYFGTQFHPEKSGENGLCFLKDVIKFYNI